MESSIIDKDINPCHAFARLIVFKAIKLIGKKCSIIFISKSYTTYKGNEENVTHFYSVFLRALSLYIYTYIIHIHALMCSLCMYMYMYILQVFP